MFCGIFGGYFLHFTTFFPFKKLAPHRTFGREHTRAHALSLHISLTHTHTHTCTRTHAHARARARAHTHTHRCWASRPILWKKSKNSKRNMALGFPLCIYCIYIYIYWKVCYVFVQCMQDLDVLSERECLIYRLLLV